ncbi:MAG: class I SAM-dependent methyltransferase, partial [Burkholderiales bacterium]
PAYWRADYGYRADWQPDKIQLLLDGERCAGLTPQEAFTKIRYERNVVKEMICDMRAVKPMREPKRELQTPPEINLALVD